LERGRWSDPAALFISQPQKPEHLPRFARCAPPQMLGKWPITAKLTDFSRFSVSRRIIFSFVKNAA
jgi:hypothetical protein